MASSESGKNNKDAILDEAFKVVIASWGEESSGTVKTLGKETENNEVIKEADKLEAQINAALRAPPTKNRLPVFEEICPSDDRNDKA